MSDKSCKQCDSKIAVLETRKATIAKRSIRSYGYILPEYLSEIHQYDRDIYMTRNQHKKEASPNDG